jgi:hypothetical protein
VDGDAGAGDLGGEGQADLSQPDDGGRGHAG